MQELWFPRPQSLSVTARRPTELEQGAEELNTSVSKGVRFSALDLNLLRIFDAVINDGSVVAAGSRLSLTPSAISHGLARLRTTLNDDLFVREGAALRPTQFAVEIAPTIHESLLRLKLMLETQGFDPSTSSRRFVVAGTDFTSSIYLPGVLKRIMEQQATVSVDLIASTGMDIVQELDAGRVDLAFGTFVEVGARFRSHMLSEVEQVFVTDKGHPAQSLSFEDLARYPHVVVRLVDRSAPTKQAHVPERGLHRNLHIGDSTVLEGLLAKNGLRRRIAAVVPHPLAVGSIVSGSQAIAMLPRPLAEVAAKAFGLRIHSDPCNEPLWPYSMVWHERTESDGALAWLRSQFATVAQQGAPAHGS